MVKDSTHIYAGVAILLVLFVLALAVIWQHDVTKESVVEMLAPDGPQVFYYHDGYTGVCWAKLGPYGEPYLVECNTEIVKKAIKTR